MFFFYYNGSGYGYKTSADGATWSAWHHIRFPQGGTYSQEGDHDIATRWTESDRHVDWVYCNNGLSKPLWYRRGYLAGTPPTIIWITEEIVQNTTNWSFAVPNVNTDANGYPWVVTVVTGAPTRHTRVWKGGVNGTSWAAGTQMTGSEGRCMEFAMLSNGYVYLLEGQDGRPDLLIGWLDDGDNSGWSAYETIITDLRRQEVFSVVNIGNNVEVVYQRDVSSVYKIGHKTRTWGVGWGSETLLADTLSLQSAPTLSATGVSDLRVFYFHQNDLYYIYREGGSWSSPEKPFGEGDSWVNPNPDGYFINSFPTGAGGGVVGVAWREGTASPYTAKFGYIGIPAYYLDVSSNPEINVNFTINATSYTTPQTDIPKDPADYTFLATNTKQIGGTLYTFNNWIVNGTDNYGTLSVTLTIGGNSTFVINYTVSSVPTIEYSVNVTSVPELNAHFSCDSETKVTPEVFNVASGSHTFLCQEATIVVGANTYDFDYWLRGSSKYYTLSITLSITVNTTLKIYYELQIEVPTEPATTGEPLYMRSDTHTVNNETQYQLKLTRSTIAITLSDSVAGSYQTSYGFRVFVLHYDGSEDEISHGTPIGTLTRAANGEGLQNNTYTPTYTRWQVGFDALKVVVYVRFGTGSWTAKATWTTERQLAKAIDDEEWTFSIYTKRDESGGNTQAQVKFGNVTYDSLIDDVIFIEPNTFEMMQYHLNNGDLIQFFIYPYYVLIGNLIYGLGMLFICGPMYLRYRSFNIILVLFALFGGTGGVFTLMVPSIALHVTWVFLLLGLAGLLWKATR
jgi:hypothetical protein